MPRGGVCPPDLLHKSLRGLPRKRFVLPSSTNLRATHVSLLLSALSAACALATGTVVLRHATSPPCSLVPARTSRVCTLGYKDWKKLRLIKSLQWKKNLDPRGSGLGVQALEDIKENEFICPYGGKFITDEQKKRLYGHSVCSCARARHTHTHTHAHTHT